MRTTVGSINGYDSYTRQPSDAADIYGHGTHCAGIAAAQINNGVGVAGIAGWTGESGVTDTTSVKIMPVRVFYYNAAGLEGTDATVADGVTWAVDHGARVISLSLGDSDPALGDTVTNPLMNDAVQYAYSHGAIVVCAAGNENSTHYFYPAAYANTISVAATNNGNGKPGWSNYGTWVNVAAPGENILSTTSDGSYNYMSGTSMACPLWQARRLCCWRRIRCSPRCRRGNSLSATPMWLRSHPTSPGRRLGERFEGRAGDAGYFGRPSQAM